MADTKETAKLIAKRKAKSAGAYAQGGAAVLDAIADAQAGRDAVERGNINILNDARKTVAKLSAGLGSGIGRMGMA